MTFECHITTRTSDAEVATAVAKEHHWKTSEIARDPVLGNDTFFYLTSHAPTFELMRNRMRNAADALRAKNVQVLREKIEHIVYDTKMGVGL